MINKNILIACAFIIVALVLVGGYRSGKPLDTNPQSVTLSGTYECLPHLNPGDVVTQECKFGLKTDDGVYYAVNFGQSANAAELFKSGAHITAEGFVVIKEALSTDMWAPYNMKGIFTITKMIDPAPVVSGKLDINVICDGALAYMTFPNAQSADTFVKECKEGKHPEVIEQYKTQMGLGDGAAI
jgi:hypothetical protein